MTNVASEIKNLLYAQKDGKDSYNFCLQLNHGLENAVVLNLTKLITPFRGDVFQVALIALSVINRAAPSVLIGSTVQLKQLIFNLEVTSDLPDLMTAKLGYEFLLTFLPVVDGLGLPDIDGNEKDITNAVVDMLFSSPWGSYSYDDVSVSCLIWKLFGVSYDFLFPTTWENTTYKVAFERLSKMYASYPTKCRRVFGDLLIRELHVNCSICLSGLDDEVSDEPAIKVCDNSHYIHLDCFLQLMTSQDNNDMLKTPTCPFCKSPMRWCPRNVAATRKLLIPTSPQDLLEKLKTIAKEEEVILGQLQSIQKKRGEILQELAGVVVQPPQATKKRGKDEKKTTTTEKKKRRITTTVSSSSSSSSSTTISEEQKGSLSGYVYEPDWSPTEPSYAQSSSSFSSSSSTTISEEQKSSLSGYVHGPDWSPTEPSYAESEGSEIEVHDLVSTDEDEE